MTTEAQLRKNHRQWVEETLHTGRSNRQPELTESIAVGSKEFAQGIVKALDRQVTGRKVRAKGDHYEVREQETAYNAHFAPKKGLLSVENGFYWNQLAE